MLKFSTQYNRALNSDRVSAIRIRQAKSRKQFAPDLFQTQHQTFSNQVAQRFTWSCPHMLPNPGVCPFGGVCHSCPARVQTKLNIGQPDDAYEREADRVAELVMRISDPFNQEEATKPKRFQGGRVQRACMDCEEELCQQPLDDEKAIPQAKEVSDCTFQVSPNLVSQLKSLRGRGRPLPNEIRSFFERRFRHDFKKVHIHTDIQAEKLARAFNARAFTNGTELVFGPREYSPITSAGRRLIAHELMHVLQQTGHEKQNSHNNIVQLSPVIGERRQLRRTRPYQELIAVCVPAGCPFSMNHHVTGELCGIVNCTRETGPAVYATCVYYCPTSQQYCYGHATPFGLIRSFCDAG